MICIFFVVISAFAWYFVAFCQRLIYEYMDMDNTARSASLNSASVGRIKMLQWRKIGMNC